MNALYRVESNNEDNILKKRDQHEMISQHALFAI